MMNNLFKCTTCNETITFEEINDHRCNSLLNEFKTIEAISYHVLKNDEGEDCLLIDGLDGVGYRVIIKEPHLIPLTEGLSCDPEHPTFFDSKKNRRRLYKASKQ